MRIAYDHQIFCAQPYGGISRYFFEVAKRINKLPGFDVHILSPLFVNKYLNADPSLKVWGKQLNYLPGQRVVRGLNETLVQWRVNREPPDVLHETYYAAHKLASSKTWTIITVYDMIHEKFPQSFPQSDTTARMKKAAVSRANH